MLQVCGITYDHTVNYGSCFQAYALQHAIEKIKMKDGAECRYQLIPIKTFKEWPNNKSLRRVVLFPLMKLHHRQFSGFEDTYMHFASVNSLSELPQLNRYIDAFVCGSDVIWNPDMNYHIKAFFLDFADGYKFSYAASFGKDHIDSAIMNSIAPLLNDFRGISVREKSGVEILKHYVSKPVRTVVDPVFLLQREEWEQQFPDIMDKHGYIFVYITHFNNSIRFFLKELKEKTGLRVIYAAAGPKQAIRQGMLQVHTPEKWLHLLKNADYVVTNSFHATAFSIVFHKKFFTVVSGDKTKGINVRMNDLLDIVGLGDRMFSDAPKELDLAEIDYTAVDTVVSNMRDESLSFLSENLENAYLLKQSKQ